MSLDARMNLTATIYRPAPSRSSTGAVTRPVPVVAQGTARCALAPKRSAVAATDAGLLLEADAVAFFPVGTDLRPAAGGSTGQGDVVEIASARYRVIAVRDPGGRGKFLEALLKREA